MKKIFGTALLALAFASSAAASSSNDSTETDKTRTVKTTNAAAGAPQTDNRAQRRSGSTDCSPQRAGVRCNRPKPRKPWFFGD